MKKAVSVTSLFFLLIVSGYAAGPDISGRLKLFSSLFLEENSNGGYFSHETGEFAFKRLEARLGLGGTLSDSIGYSLRFDIFSRPEALFSGDSFPQSTELGSPLSAEPAEFSLYECYVKISDFLIRGVDLTFGKQRIPWGTADKISVVDNLNPVDFANFFTFDPDYFAERRPQTALNLEFWLSGMTKLQLVWLASRQYAPLPSGFTALASGVTTPPSFQVEKDKPLLKNTNWGMRLSTVLLNTDIALSFYRGNFHLPVLSGLSLGPDNTTLMNYTYPQKKVASIDLSGEVFSLGFWLEAALVIPERESGFLTVPVFLENEPQLYTQSFSLFETEYVEYVIGMDYTVGLGSGIYINAQFFHGFFDERDYSDAYQSNFGFSHGMFFGEIEDYLMVSAEYNLFNGDLNCVLGGLVEFSGKKAALALMPALEARIYDSLSIQAGAFLVTGNEEITKFGPFKKDKLVYLALKINF